MPFLLMVFLTLACLPGIHRDHGEWPEPTWIGSSRLLSAALSALLLGVPIAFAFVLSRRVRWELAHQPERREHVLRRYETARRRHQVVLFVVYALALCVCGWGWLIGQVWARGGDDGNPWPGAELLVLAPFLIALLMSWLFFFDAEVACYRSGRQPRLEDLLLDRLPSDDTDPLPPLLSSRRAYVGYQLRHKLALVFIPLGLLLLQKEANRLFPELWQEWYAGATLGGAASLFALLLGMPWLLRLVLGLEPLPPGPLRARLTAAAARLRFRYTAILLWNTGHGMANAMVVGLLPWPRYVVFTDRLLDEFRPEEVEAVLGHEIGHVRHWHMPLYLGFLTASMAVFSVLVRPLLGVADNLASDGWTHMAGWVGLTGSTPVADGSTHFWSLHHHPYLKAVPAIAALLAYIFVVFGFLSRRCERQADVFGCRAVSCGDPHCTGHDRDTPLALDGAGLCPTGIRTFMRALDKVAVLNGISRDRPGFLQSWQHSTIAKRVAFLEGMLADPRREPSFQRRLLLVKCGLLAVLAMALLLAAGLGEGP